MVVMGMTSFSLSVLGRQDCDEDDNNSIYELVHLLR